MAGLAGVTLSPRTIDRSAEAAGAGRVDERQLTGLRAAQQIGIVVRADGNLGDGQAGQLPGVRWPRRRSRFLNSSGPDTYHGGTGGNGPAGSVIRRLPAARPISHPGILLQNVDGPAKLRERPA